MGKQKTGSPTFPVVLLQTGKEQMPKDAPIVIIMAANGKFMRKRMGIVDATVPWEGNIPSLATCSTDADLNVNKLPFELLMQILHFMRVIYNTHKTECNVVLFYKLSTGEWAAGVPPQTTSHASVHYTDGAGFAHEGLLKVGTIHSHCDFGASHSGGDYQDEKNFDGIHITFGHVDTILPPGIQTVG
jgi:hypothetical protein